MTRTQYLHTKLFENKLFRSQGDEFQQYFYKLAIRKYRNFIKVDNNGISGDKKNDGYLKGEGIFFQVYGPKATDTNQSIQSYAIKKMNDDFYCLLSIIKDGFWEELKEFIFVFKIHRGYYPELLEKIDSLKKNNPNIGFSIYDIDKLIEIFSTLDEDSMSLVDDYYIEEPDFELISIEILSDIINNLTQNVNLINKDITLSPPDFEDKIKFNNICDFYAQCLRTGSYFINDVDECLFSYPNKNMGDLVCGVFKELYENSKITYPDSPDSQFYYILNSCFQEKCNNKIKNSYSVNCYALMAKYFESCDVFEQPK